MITPSTLVDPTTPVTPSNTTSNVSYDQMIDAIVAELQQVLVALQKVQDANQKQQETQGNIAKENAVLTKKSADENQKKLEDYYAAEAEASKWGIFSKIIEIVAPIILTAFAVVTFGSGTAASVAAGAAIAALLDNCPGIQGAVNAGPDALAKACGASGGADFFEAAFKIVLVTALTAGAGSMATTVDVTAERTAAMGAETGSDAAAQRAADAAADNAAKFNAASKGFARTSMFAQGLTAFNPALSLIMGALKASGKDSADNEFYAQLASVIINLIASLAAMKVCPTAGGAQPLTRIGTSDAVYQALTWGNRVVYTGSSISDFGNGWATMNVGDIQGDMQSLQGDAALGNGRESINEKTLQFLQSLLSQAVSQLGALFQNASAYTQPLFAEAQAMIRG